MNDNATKCQFGAGCKNNAEFNVTCKRAGKRPERTIKACRNCASKVGAATGTPVIESGESKFYKISAIAAYTAGAVVKFAKPKNPIEARARFRIIWCDSPRMMVEDIAALAIPPRRILDIDWVVLE